VIAHHVRQMQIGLMLARDFDPQSALHSGEELNLRVLRE